MSYVNNLHPHKHQNLYAIIEQMISRVIPLWNMTLTPLKYRQNTLRRIPYSSVFYDPDPELGPDDEGPQRVPEVDDDNGDGDGSSDEDEDGSAEEAYYERREEWIRATRRVVRPEPAEFQIPEKVTNVVDLRRDYGKGGLQIIVKLANIHLTPDKPEYEGGTWHVEGQLVRFMLILPLPISIIL